MEESTVIDAMCLKICDSSSMLKLVMKTNERLLLLTKHKLAWKKTYQLSVSDSRMQKKKFEHSTETRATTLTDYTPIKDTIKMHYGKCMQNHREWLSLCRSFT